MLGSLNIADIIVIILVALSAFLGYKKGFVKTGFGLLSVFVAIVVTIMFYKPVANLIRENTGFETWLTDYIYSIDFEEGKEISGDVSGEYVGNFSSTVIDLLGIKEVKENAKLKITEKIVDFVLNLISIVLIYVVARLALSVVVMILDAIMKIPVLKQCNEVLGLMLGTLLGFIKVYMACAILSLLASFPFAEGIISFVNASYFTHIFYNNNLLLQILF